ncbi:MAG: MBL fold metallo-hydrolase [Oscillospiraceae bacterium]|nr:MBL fold metallo-hydrolase [Oscillospiraceae bacterium]
MNILTFNANPMDQNIYLCHDAKSAVLIDAGCSQADIAAIMQTLEQQDLTLMAILLTHGHGDHILAVQELKQRTNVAICAHAAECAILSNPAWNLSGRFGTDIVIAPDITFEGGATLNFGNLSFKTLHTPGHTAGGTCYYDAAGGNLFVGDTIFKGSIGRTDLPTGDEATLLQSIADKILTLSNNTNLYPGHGEATTIADEKAHNPYCSSQ